MQTITADQLKLKLDEENGPVMLDVREDWEYEICSLPDSINISMSDTGKMLDTLNPEDEIVVICHHGMRSFQVASYLLENGFNNVYNLEGGIDNWAKTIDTTMAQY